MIKFGHRTPLVSDLCGDHATAARLTQYFSRKAITVVTLGRGRLSLQKGSEIALWRGKGVNYIRSDRNAGSNINLICPIIGINKFYAYGCSLSSKS